MIRIIINSMFACVPLITYATHVTNSSESHMNVTWYRQVNDLSYKYPMLEPQFKAFDQTLETIYANGEGLIMADRNRIVEAALFAAEKHRFQVRKDPKSTPYIVHPIGVARSLMTIGRVRDPDIIIAALLHDTVEDTDTSFEEIEELFGPRVTAFVREVTDDKSLPKEKRKQLQIEHAHHKSAGAAQVKLADKLYNLTDLATEPPLDWEEERIDTYFTWAQAVVDNLPWVNDPLLKAVHSVIANYWDAKIK